jgi:probable selenate reductase FAD-binding subunit
MRTIVEYYRPQHLEEALNLLARADVTTVPIGGASELIAEGRSDAQAVVDLRDLGLSYVRHEGDTLRIGATTTLQTLIDTPESAGAWDSELARVVELTAARNLREQGTLAGTLVAAESNNPLAVTLLALDAALSIAPRNDAVSLNDFFTKRRSLLHASLITEITFPLPDPAQTIAFEKVSRTPADLPIVCAAARVRVEEGTLRDVRIALGGVSAAPIRAVRFEGAAEGQPIESIAFEALAGELDPPSDFLGSREYRREMAARLTRRALLRIQHFNRHQTA